MAEAKGVISKVATLVLGMHRSGTSALTGELATLGVTMPKTLMAPSDENPKGYFESLPIMSLNDEILAAAGSKWDDWRPLDLTSLSGRFDVQIANAIEQEFGDATHIAIKDPRLCRIAPLWFNVLAELGYLNTVIIPYRHPLEVAESLFARRSMPIEFGLLLWLRHVVDSEYFSRSYRRICIYMPDMLSNWISCRDQIEQMLDLKFAAPAKAESAPHLDQSLKHHNYEKQLIELRPELRTWVRTGFYALERLNSDSQASESLQTFDNLRSALDDASHLFAPIISNLENNVSKLITCQSELSACQSQLTQLQKDVYTTSQEHIIARSELATRTGDIEYLTKRLSISSTKSIVAVAKLKQYRIDKISASRENADLQSKIADLNRRIVNIDDENKYLRQRNAELSSQSKNLEERSNHLTLRAEHLETELKNTADIVNDIKLSFSESTDRTIKHHESEKAIYENIINKLNADMITTTHAAYDNIQKLSTAHIEERNTLQNRVESLLKLLNEKEASHSAKVADIEAQLELDTTGRRAARRALNTYLAADFFKYLYWGLFPKARPATLDEEQLL